MTLINAKRFDFVKGDEKSGTIIVNVLCISKCVDSTAIFSQSALLPRY